MKHAARQSGQTLIETLVAVFMLVMGITAALGLATFSLHSSTNILKQLIGMGQAREGIEIVKNMRDTNWLQDTFVPNGCYNYRTNTAASAACYPLWLNPGTAGSFNLDPGVVGTPVSYRLWADPTSAKFWTLQLAPNAFAEDFDSAAAANGYYYNPPGGKVVGLPDNFGTLYFRKIVLTLEQPAPYSADSHFGRLKVDVQVWWTDKNCTSVADFPGVGRCGVQLTTYLTNWKNYQ